MYLSDDLFTSHRAYVYIVSHYFFHTCILYAGTIDESQQQIVTSDTQRNLTKIASSGINARVCDNPGLGYWTGNIWNAVSCVTKQWTDKKEAGKCIRNKSLYFLGDSTTRQWVVTLLKLLQEQEENIEPFTKGIRCIGYFRKYNFNLTFQFHPHRLGSYKDKPLNGQKFFVEILDSLRDSRCNYVVTVSLWAHFAQWWLPAYKERLRLISKAIRRFKKRCPDAPVIVKGPHVRHDSDSPPVGLLMHSDYIMFKIKAIMEEILNIDGVYYIDIWNMNLAYPAKKTTHMPEEVIQQEVNLYLSSICP